jgi:hypothetical protein
VTQQLASRPDYDVEPVDLRDHRLPFFGAARRHEHP